ncbi:MAG: N-acetyl-D-Glu racemase DgcA [Hyphomicrobiaceae bacterium]
MAVVLKDVRAERWPVAGAFTISRGSRTEAEVVVATLTDGTHDGRGEAVPYARYDESVPDVMAAIETACRGTGDLSPARLLECMPPGAARNALDCALLDLEAKRSGIAVADRLALPPRPETSTTCFTLSLGEPDHMALAARKAADKPLLKIKLGGGREDQARLQAIRQARPDARLVADANESWSPQDLRALLRVAANVGVELVEQPLPAGADAILATIDRPVPVCADESAHTAQDIAGLIGRYDCVNIKLDKAGGLTAALAMAKAAEAAGLSIMVGCMLSTSLAMAPAWLLSPWARWLDLDGPLLLAKDRTPAVTYASGGQMCAPPRALWG